MVLYVRICGSIWIVIAFLKLPSYLITSAILHSTVNTAFWQTSSLFILPLCRTLEPFINCYVLFFAIGILGWRQWARKAALIFIVIALAAYSVLFYHLTQGFFLIPESAFNFALFVAGLCFLIGNLYFLTGSGIKEKFNSSRINRLILSKREVKVSVAQKAILVSSGIILCLFVLETGLRLGGFVYDQIYKLPRDKGADYRIFCVGESTTFGIGTSNPALYNYPRQLEEILNAKSKGARFQCFFDQNIGSNTSETLIKLPFYIEQYRPDLAIFMVGANNWWSLNKSNILIFNKGKSAQRFLRFLVFMDRFRTFKLLKWIAYSQGLWKVSAAKWMNEFAYADIGSSGRARELNTLLSLVQARYDLNIFDQVAYYDLCEMVKRCKARKIKVIICSYPGSLGGKLDIAQKDVAGLFVCPFVDNSSIFKNLPDRGEYFSEDHWHPNEKGYRLLAENVYSCILQNKLFP